MKTVIFSLLFFLFPFFSFSQNKQPERKSLIKSQSQVAKDAAKKASITLYKIISIQKDTTFVDTMLSIKKEYQYNYLRKDMFGTMPFPNEGQPSTILNFGYNMFSKFPEFGYTAKHATYQQVDDVNYYSVATPYSEIYYKTVLEQGQSVETLITLNTSKQFNFSVSYRGLRSLGKYINQATNAGNFKFTASYVSKNNKYGANFHFLDQDISNGENGGLTSPSNFESGDGAFKDRPRLQVYLTDAKSILKGKRFFIDHKYQINKSGVGNNIFFNHQFMYEHKLFIYDQQTVPSLVGTASVQRFGTVIGKQTTINNQNRYDLLYNKFDINYETINLGKLQFFIENFNSKYYNTSDLIVGTAIIPSTLSNNITTIGAQYQYRKNRWNGTFSASNSISKQNIRSLEANLTYKLNNNNNLYIQYQNLSKLPNNIFIQHQSSYLQYNWNYETNNFKNQKINNLVVATNTKYANLKLQITNLTNHLYFYNDTTAVKQYIKPKQFSGSVNYLSIQANREFKYKKFALDNTILYQKVVQSESILNVPQVTMRNTLYYSNYFYKKALYVQTGAILNYFTKYTADDYNPVLGEFFIQNETQIGNFPMIDVFVNARIRQTRIFLKAEHINSGFSGNKFFSAPNLPYRDFIIRFGVVWSFFQ